MLRSTFRRTRLSTLKETRNAFGLVKLAASKTTRPPLCQEQHDPGSARKRYYIRAHELTDSSSAKKPDQLHTVEQARPIGMVKCTVQSAGRPKLCTKQYTHSSSLAPCRHGHITDCEQTAWFSWHIYRRNIHIQACSHLTSAHSCRFSVVKDRLHC